MPPETADLPLLPDFLVIGAMKCGTTTLFHDLRAQPGIFVGEKEPNLLLDGEIAGYEAFFRKANPDQVLGEISPDYAKLPDRSAGVVATALAAYASRKPKIIYLVRDPLERVESHHRFDVTQQGRMSQGMPADIDRAVRECPQLLDYTRYRMQLAPWIDAFGRESVLVIRFAEYVADREETVARICEFVGAEFNADALNASLAWNVSDGRPVATPGWRWLLDQSWYRRGLRAILPETAREWLRQHLLPRTRTGKSEMSLETRAFLRRELNAELEDLL